MRRGLVMAGVVVAAWFAWIAFSGSDGSSIWIRVARSDLVLGVEVTGSLEAESSAQIGPPQISELYDFKISLIGQEGVPVTAGDEILGFDTTELEQRLRTEMTRVASARKEIEKKEIDLAIDEETDALRLTEARSELRKAQLKAEHPRELVSGIEHRKAELELELAVLELRSLENQIQAARVAGEAELAGLRNDLQRAEQAARRIQRSIERMTVRAPRDGIVIAVTDWQHQKKKVGDTCWYGDMVLEIPDLSRMRAEGEVRESQVGNVRGGQPVRLRLDAHPDVEYLGRVGVVQRVVQSRSWRSDVKVVRLSIELETTDAERMRPGMRFRGLIETERKKDVLVVPNEAVKLTPEGPVVFRRTLLGLEATRVRLGAQGQGRVEVIDGIGQDAWIAAERPAESDDDNLDASGQANEGARA